MDNHPSTVPENNHSSNKTNYNRAKKVAGVNNWALALFILLCSNLVIDNYTSYGIIKNPVELTFQFVQFLQVNWSCFVIVFLGYLVQILLCFGNEKLLALRLLPEWLGMTLHVFITLSLFNLCAIVFPIYNLTPAAGIVVMSHVFLMTVKFWGYAYANQQYRNGCAKQKSLYTNGFNGKIHQEDQEKVDHNIKYPQNVTFKNAVQFLACTGSCLYTIDDLNRKAPDLKKVFKGILRTIVIYYTSAFLIYQFLIPEADKAVSHIATGHYLSAIGSILKLALPVNAVWLLFFYFYCLQTYLPILGWFWGVEDIKLGEDWWNSENSSIFWIKWNYQVHMWLKRYIYLPLLEKGYAKRTAAFVVALVSGFLHEYLISVPCGTCYGLAVLAMISQIPLAIVTSFVHRTYGGQYGNLLFWLFFIIAHSSCAVSVYYNYINLQ